MSADDRREILRKVRDGELTPEEAERLLRELDDAPPARTTPPPAPAPRGSGEVRKVRVAVAVGAVDVVGDTSVSVAEADGPHTARTDGDALVIEGTEDEFQAGSFTFKVKRRPIKVNVSEGGRAYAFAHGGHAGHPLSEKRGRLVIRMNPDLDLDVELDAGPLSITGVRGPIRARVAAGPISIDDFRGPLDVAVNAGAVRATGIVDHGESRVRSDAGAIRVRLLPGSDVRVLGSAAIGRVVVPGGGERSRPSWKGGRCETVIGSGRATLRVDTAMGSVHVTCEDER